MITGIVTLCGGIAVMLGSGVAVSTALAWMNNFDVDLKGRKSKTRGPHSNHSRASEGRNRLAGKSSIDMFE